MPSLSWHYTRHGVGTCPLPDLLMGRHRIRVGARWRWGSCGSVFDDETDRTYDVRFIGPFTVMSTHAHGPSS